MLASFFFFSSRRRHTRYWRDWSSDVCSSDLDGAGQRALAALLHRGRGHPADATCADCLAAGRVLAPAIGAMLLAARRKGRMPLTPNDYDAIGSALEELEQAARTRVAIKRRA